MRCINVAALGWLDFLEMTSAGEVWKVPVLIPLCKCNEVCLWVIKILFGKYGMFVAEVEVDLQSAISVELGKLKKYNTTLGNWV